jgi:ATP-dependent Zn protease
MVILSFFSTRLQTAQISYSTFLREIQIDNIKELNILGDRIEGILETEIEDNERTFTPT